MTGALDIKRTTSSSLAIDNNLKIGATRYILILIMVLVVVLIMVM